MLLVTIDRVNASEGYRFDQHTEKTEDQKGLYQQMRRSYGRCTGHVYQDMKGGPRPVGWVFVKREPYDDSPTTFLQETWVTVAEPPRPIDVTKELR